jgi:hypothetical protein
MNASRPFAQIDPFFSAFVINTTVHGLLLGFGFGLFSGACDAVAGRWPPTLEASATLPEVSGAARPARVFGTVLRNSARLGGHIGGVTLVYSTVAGGVQSIRGGDKDGLDVALGVTCVCALQPEFGPTLALRLPRAVAVGALCGVIKTALYAKAGKLER